MAEKVIIDDSIVANEVNTFNWSDIAIDVKRFLSAKDAMGFINDIIDGCVDENGNYFPEVLDFVRRKAFICYYTNIELPEETMAEYKILYGTELYNKVYEQVDLDQLDVLWSAVNERINMIKNDRMMAVEKRMAEIYAMMGNLTDILNKTVGEVTGEQISDFIKTLANSTVDESKIVSALLDEKEKRKEAQYGNRVKDGQKNTGEVDRV